MADKVCVTLELELLLLKHLLLTFFKYVNTYQSNMIFCNEEMAGEMFVFRLRSTSKNNGNTLN